jgi:DnaJ-class molecular chaperone with C-terminal Zn finger domain
VFERDGDDLHCHVPVSMAKAALGGGIDVPTLGGKAEIDLPEGTQAARPSACAAKASKACVRAIPVTCIATSRWRRRSSSTRSRSVCCASSRVAEKGGDRHSPQAKSWFDKAKEFFKPV